MKLNKSPLINLKSTMISSLDDVFDEMFTHTFPSLSKEFGLNFANKAAYPKVDIIDYSDRIVIEAEICGLSKNDIEIKVIDNNLTIRGKKQETKENTEINNERYIKKEIKRSSFERGFILSPNIVDKSKISAKFEYGSVFITLPKVKYEEPKPVVNEIKID